MFHLHDYIHGLMSQYFANKEMDELYVSVGIKALAQSIITIFIPVYLYKLGLSISSIALYYLIFYFTISFCMYFAMKLNHKIGLKKVLALGTLILIAYYYLLDSLQNGTIHYDHIWGKNPLCSKRIVRFSAMITFPYYFPFTSVSVARSN